MDSESYLITKVAFYLDPWFGGTEIKDPTRVYDNRCDMYLSCIEESTGNEVPFKFGHPRQTFAGVLPRVGDTIVKTNKGNLMYIEIVDESRSVIYKQCIDTTRLFPLTEDAQRHLEQSKMDQIVKVETVEKE